jgi:hypothetical protein
MRLADFSDWEDSEGMWDDTDVDDSDWESQGAVASDSSSLGSSVAARAPERDVIVIDDDSEDEDSGEDTDVCSPHACALPARLLEERLEEIGDLMDRATGIMKHEERSLETVWKRGQKLLPDDFDGRRRLSEKAHVEYLARKLVNDARLTHHATMSKACKELEALNSSLGEINAMQVDGLLKFKGLEKCAGIARSALRAARHIGSAYFAIPRIKVFWSGKSGRLDVQFE